MKSRSILFSNIEPLNPAIEQRERKDSDPYNKVEDQIYKSLMYTEPQSCIGGKTTRPFGCMLVLPTSSPTFVGHHFWRSLILLHKSMHIRS
jgi:hypothetical protein